VGSSPTTPTNLFSFSLGQGSPSLAVHGAPMPLEAFVLTTLGISENAPNSRNDLRRQLHLLLRVAEELPMVSNCRPGHRVIVQIIKNNRTA
jgi:hypothetical protein